MSNSGNRGGQKRKGEVQVPSPVFKRLEFHPKGLFLILSLPAGSAMGWPAGQYGPR